MIESIAIIGLGNITNRHRKNVRALFPKAKIVVMSASGRIPTECINDYDEIVTSIDEIIKKQVSFAIVASPATFHAIHSRPLIEAGIPVLIEKPISSSNEDAELLENIELKTNVPVAVAYCLRYLPSTQIVKQLITEKKIGRIYNAYIEIGQYLPDWRPSKDYRTSVSANKNLGGGALLELSHELDYAQYILGFLSLNYAILRSSEELKLDVEDSADIMLHTNDGTIVNMHLDFLQKKAYRKCRFVGSNGSLEWDLIRNEVVLIGDNTQETIFSDPSWDKNLMYIEMIKDFVCKIQNQSNTCISVQSATSTVKLINQIKQFKKV